MKLMLLLLMFCLLIQKIISLSNLNENISYSSNITLKIRGIGIQRILGEINYATPSAVYINNIFQVSINSKYNLTKTENVIQLVYNNEITNCDGLFKECSNITEIDLSNFDSSQVTQMCNMFQDCFSLTSLDLTNLNTSKVNLMDNMFYNCYSLLSLDLSYFNTSQVTKMVEMFYNCSTLTSLNLSNFDFSKIGSAYGMFGSCTSLEYLNIENFIFFSGKEYGNIFENTPKNLIICANESNINEQTNSINLGECVIISCSNDWREKRKKINLENDTCVDNCERIGTIEQNGKCLKRPNISCPEETPFIIINKPSCVDNCSFNDIVNKNCIMSTILNNSEDIMLNFTLNYLKSNSFSDDIFKNSNYVAFEEKRVKFNLSKFSFDNIEPYNCQPSFNENDNNNNNFYLLNISVKENSKEPKKCI